MSRRRVSLVPGARTLATFGPATLAACAGVVAHGRIPMRPRPSASASRDSLPPADPNASAVVPGRSLPLAPRITADSVNTHTSTRDHMIAALEMQLSGEPLAEAMGRDRTGYNRGADTRDVYNNPRAGTTDSGLDLVGFASAIESYEYSKQAMNSVAFESGAGTSLAFGPLMAPGALTGVSALARLRTRVQSLAAQSNATSRFVHASVTANNPLGWPGLWPVLQPFVSYDPSIHATNAVNLHCSITSDDTGPGRTPLVSDDYECDATSLHLPSRETQAVHAIGPGASGWADWKNALWTQNYLQQMHDGAEASVTQVASDDVVRVGAHGNTVRGANERGENARAGTYLGSSDIEGFQAGLFLDMLDNQAAQWLGALTTMDGVHLGGFADTSAALAYDERAPLRWFPAEIAVRESTDASGFPRPTDYTVRTAASHTLDLAGMVGGYATAYALTDHANHNVGGAGSARAYFDGAPFADDNQVADGENTLHDRALAMVRVAVVNLDRMHRDARTGLLADDATVTNGVAEHSSIVSTETAAYTLWALRTARRALDSNLSLYGNTTPDTAGIPTPIDAPAIDGVTFGEKLESMVRDTANAFMDKLTESDGRAYAGWDLAHDAPTDGATSLDAHAAAVRGLLTGYLVTGDTRFRERAERVLERLDTVFYDATVAMYRPVANEALTQVTFTPRRFGVLQGALRDAYEMIAAHPGREALRETLRDRLARLDKLVLNGWNDRNGNGLIDGRSECVNVVNGLARGGLQMAERTLSGETGSETDPTAARRVIGTDRDRDCVPEVSAAGLPATLADAVTFHIENH